MKIKRNFHLYILMNAFLIYERLQGQSIAIYVSVPIEFGVLPPAIPGDPPVSTYENTLGDAYLDIDGGNRWGYGNTWGVTVNKTTTSWNTNLSLDILRDTSLSYLSGGTNYITIPDTPTSALFFSCSTQRRARPVYLQQRVRISGGEPPAGIYTTTITYTLVDL